VNSDGHILTRCMPFFVPKLMETIEAGYLVGSLPKHLIGDDLSVDVIGTLYHQKNNYEGGWDVFYSTTEKTYKTDKNEDNFRTQSYLLFNGKSLYSHGKSIIDAENEMWKLLN